MALLVALPVAAAVIALWLVARRPTILPDSFRRALAHFVLSLLIVEFAPGALAPLISAGRLTASLAFLAVLSALVYAWVAVAAVLCTVKDAIAE